MTDIELKRILLSKYEEKDVIESADNRINATWSVYIHVIPKNITHHIRDKYYVGITGRSPKDRWENGKGYKNNPFGKAISKYGWENIEHYIIADHLTKAEAENFERALIKKLSSNKSEFGYNRTNGGDSNDGAIRSEEFKRNVSRVVKERWVDPKYREKHSGENCYFKTHKFSFSGGNHIKAKKIVLLNNNKVFDSIANASEETGINRNNISLCLNNPQKYAGEKDGEKLVWVYYDDYINMTEDEIKGIVKSSQLGKAKKLKDPYVCLNTREIFEYLGEANKFAGLVRRSTKISECCNHTRYSAGKDVVGNCLVWVRDSEYKTMSEDDINRAILSANPKTNRKKVVDIQEKTIYNSIDSCAKHTGISHSAIQTSANDKFKTSKYKGRFSFYDNYINNNSIKEFKFID